jgi:molybdopterin-containing oxidoreductase family iron-sulfur binding subunit
MPELDRRSFLQLVGLTAGAAAAAGCKEPVETVIPYLNQPEEIIPGIATYYASACRECPIGCGIHVKTREGRPIKVEGNPDDPASGGALCVRGQASLARTYDSTRHKGPMMRVGEGLVATSWEDAYGALAEKLGAAGSAAKVFFLSGLETGALDKTVDDFLTALGTPAANRLRYETYAYEPMRKANEILFGQATVPKHRFDKADVVVAFGTDFLETWLAPVAAQRGFAASRREGRGYAAYVGPRLSLTGASCDTWLAPEPGTEIFVALGLAAFVAEQRGGADLAPLRTLLAPYTLASVAERTGLPQAKLSALGARLARAEAPLALPPGQELCGSNATAFAAAVQILNYVCGAIGTTVEFGPNHRLDGLGTFADLAALSERLDRKEIDVLLIHGVNPVYTAPQLGLAGKLRQSDMVVVSFASAPDETSDLADFVLPDHTPYEAWGDVEPTAGVRLLQQPTIRPLFDTRSTGDVLIELAAASGKPLAGGGAFRDKLVAAWPELDAALARGGRFEPAAPQSVSLASDLSALRFEAATPAAGDGSLALLVYPSLAFYDGRSARIPHLQEIPDPVTKLVWGSYAELHPKTAAELGIREGDVVSVTTPVGQVELPAFPHEAIRPGAVAISVGQGHQPVDAAAPAPDRWQRRTSIGVHALALLPRTVDSVSGALAWLSTRATVAATGRKVWLAKPQASFDQEGRGVAQATTLAALRAASIDPELGADGGTEPGEPAEGHGEGDVSGHSDRHAMAPYADAMHLPTEPFDPADDQATMLLGPDGQPSPYRWGMAIDLDACTGCNACITACATENNIPAVGEQLAREGREMAWIRLERYVEHHGDEIEVRQVPMLCQHCASAPCESVCPVYATYHNREGLNVMVPNRCIGTRYCGNNCPYKVRRFNYYPYEMDMPEVETLALNPDVTVRTKGVMEKCSFCVQRIHVAKQKARSEGRPVREGDVTPACAQTCPSQAIVFGNHKTTETDSPLRARQRDARAYWAFHHLNTRPGVTYLKSIRRATGEREV